jgi:hypothetical protein
MTDVWTSVSIGEGRDCIGAFRDCGEEGFETVVGTDDDIFIGMFEGDEAAHRAISDHWERESRSNGGDNPGVKESEGTRPKAAKRGNGANPLGSEDAADDVVSDRRETRHRANGGNGHASEGPPSMPAAALGYAESAKPRICAECCLDPPDGTEQLKPLNGGEGLWLHRRCEDAFARRRMAEEGLPWTIPRSSAPAPTATGNGNGHHGADAEDPAPRPSATPPLSLAAPFLEKLRPGGPWVLTAIVPDGKTMTVTAHTADDVNAFVRVHNGKMNLYYSVNPTRTAMSKKAAKTDIAAIEYVLGDLDPAAGETPEAAKARYLDQLNGASEPRPTAVIDSGNGIQCLWRLSSPIVLGNPINGEFSPEDQARIDDAEARIAAVMLRCGAKAGTQNIDRILRLPGTTNLPNAKKRKERRVECQTTLLWFDDVGYPLDVFPKGENEKKSEKNKSAKAGYQADPLAQAIRESAPKGERSEVVWFVINEMLRRGYRPDAIVQVLLDRKNGVSEHVYDQAEPREYAARQVRLAIEKIDFARDDKKKIIPIAANIRIALLKLGVSVRYDRFADRTLLDGLAEFGPALEDAAVNRLWLQIMERLGFAPGLELMRIVVEDMARLNGFHPVCDYLDALQWDGLPRVDKWLVPPTRVRRTANIRGQ